MKKIFPYLNYKKRIIICFLITICLSACESFMDVDLPDSQLTGETVFADIETANAAVTSIYSKLANNVLVCGNPNGISILLGNYTDELQPYNSGLLEFDFYQNNLIASNASVTSLWNGSYNLIYAANAVIEGLENSATIPESDKRALLGEAYFLRAFIHFYLLNLYGEIPYVTTTDYTINASIEKIPENRVYEMLTADLEEAKVLMSAENQSPLRVRPDINTVKALLARIHLYNNNWGLAEMEAGSVINSGQFTWVEALNDVFFKTSTGTIWQLMPGNEGLPTQEGQSFIFTSGPPPNRALSMHLIDAFETGDLRKEHWVGSVTDEESTWYFPYKYKQFVPEAESSEYSILFRLEEMYLIRAEARIHLGDIDGAKNDINKIRNRASLANTTASTQQELMEAVLQERKVEFFSELGYRFFDLKRNGLLNTVLSPVKPGWSATNTLWPIPETELLLNPNLLPQNPGY